MKNDVMIRSYHTMFPDHSVAELVTMIKAERGVRIPMTTFKDALLRMGITRQRSGNHGVAEKQRALAQAEKLSDLADRLQRDAYANLCPSSVIRPPKLPGRYLFGDDVHGNFWNPAVTDKMLEWDGDADGYFLFEALTLDTFSHFRQTYHAPGDDELRMVNYFFDQVKGRFGSNVWLGLANHNIRFMKWIADRTSNSEQVEMAAKMWEALFSKIVTNKPNLVGSTRMQLGRALMSHPDIYLKATGFTALRAAGQAEASWQAFGLEPPFQLSVVGHPHRLGMVQWEGRQGFLGECGCQCFLPRYVVENSKPTLATQFSMTNGYFRLTLDKDGNVDFTNRNTGPVFVGWAGLPEKFATTKEV